MARVKVHTDDLAARLIDAAGRLLAAEGAAALTTRRVAALTGTSTTAVYSLFGDKSGLLAAMYTEGFRRLEGALRAVPTTDDPLADLFEIGLAYRASALANPHLYELMFGHPDPAFRPGRAETAVADAAYRPLLDAVRRCLRAGAFTGEAEGIATHLWGVVHGLVSLELHGWLAADPATRERRYRDGLAASGAGHIAPAEPPPRGGR